jgi:hypothetical protein
VGGHATAITAPGPTDAVFHGGIVHHVPDQRTLAEHRDPPGGRPAERSSNLHPDRRRPSASQGSLHASFRRARAVSVVATQTLWNRFGWFVADRDAS